MTIYQLKKYNWNGKGFDVELKHLSQHLDKVMLVGKKYIINGDENISIDKMEQDEMGDLVCVHTYDDVDIRLHKVLYKSLMGIKQTKP